ncbi:hypothetical protein QO034_14000 [Sedimentitalea sp. JM2-8]|uniref:Uncharacterized protein n=1 Tax=Sedimentitalea xiamensis TaxID=3050037 RepID=A0ABT7FGI1_9RHOB|nr:hypothetical protein [Sedimentitalea xiamensis]MDK3074227.1 hypothetical protein [Sedimentitalea xiamensis]
MGKIFSSLMMACLVAAPATQGFAQALDPGVSEARVRLACGTGRVVGAETLANGSIRVTCSQESRLPAELAGAGLTPEVAAGIAAAVVVIILIGDDDSNNTSTTTTTRGSNF